MDSWKYDEENVVSMFGSDEEVGTQIPTQAQSIVEGSGTVLVSEFKPVQDVDYLQVCNYCVPNWLLFFILILFGGYSTMMHNRGLLLHKTFYKLLNLPSLYYHDDVWHWHFSR